MGPTLIVAGITLVVLSAITSSILMRRAIKTMGEDLALQPGSGAVPKALSLLCLVGLLMAIAGVIVWVVT